MDFLNHLIQPAPPILASGIEIGLLVAGVALSALAGIFLKPKPTKSPLTRNNTGGTYAERGAIIPYVQGSARIGPIVGWLSKAKSTTVTTNEGFLGFGEEKIAISKQSAWHILCVGPADRLEAIIQGGARIFPTKDEVPLNRSTHPSGTSIALKSKQGTFKIFWGETDQPTCPELISVVTATPGVGVASRWPNICYIVWINKVLDRSGGRSTYWPNLEYVVQCRPFEDKINGTTPLLLGASDPWIGPAITAGALDEGCNAAHVISNILHNTFPHGIGIPTTCTNIPALNTISAYLSDQTGMENLPVNIIVQESDEALRTVGEICQDMGMVIPQVGAKLVPVLVRAVLFADTPVLTDAVLIPPLPEKEFLFGERSADRLNFVYKEKNYNYRDGDVTVDSDGEAQTRPRLRKIEVNTISTLNVMQRIVNRRQLEEFASVRTYRLTVARGVRCLSPGQVLFHADFGTLRIAGVERRTDSPATTIEALEDLFSKPPAGFTIAAADPIDLEIVPIRDDQYDFREAPPPLAIVDGDKKISVIVLRQRASNEVEGAEIQFSANGETYTQARGVIGKAAYCTLAFDMPEFQVPMLDYVYLTTPAQLDLDVFQDLTSDPIRWRSGAQLAFIDNEIFFIKGINVLSPSSIIMFGVIRDRLGSIRQDHTAGDACYLVPFADLEIMTHPSIAFSRTVDMLALPYGGSSQIDASEAEPPAEHVITGQSLAPYPPAGFRADDNPYEPTVPMYWVPLNSYASGGNIRFRWANRTRLSNGTGAGTCPAGVAVEFPGVMDGELNILIEDYAFPGAIKRWIKIKEGKSYSYQYSGITLSLILPPVTTDSDERFFMYDYGDMIGDFGGAVTLRVRVYQADGSYTSIQKEIIVFQR